MTWSQAREFVLLGVRLAWSRDRRQRWRQISVALGAFVLAATITVSTALVGAGFDADARGEARRAVWSSDEDPPLWISVRGEIWDGRQFPVIWLEGAEGAPVPPGLAALPEPGRAVVSPSIAQRPEVVEGLGLRLSGAGTGPQGTIGAEGLLAASEWWVYTRAPEGRDLGEGGALIPVSHFGGTADEAMSFDTDRAAPGGAPTLAMAWIFLLFPALVLAWSCARSRSQVRVQRFEILHRLGLGRGSLRVLGAVEVLALALPAALLAGVVCSAVLPRTRTLPLTGLVLHERALALPWWAWPVTVVGSVVIFTTLATVGQVSPRETLARKPRRTVPTSRWRVVPLLLGLVLVLAGKALAGSNGVLVLLGGVLVTLGALPFAVPHLTHYTGRLVARDPRPAPWLAGKRLVEFSTRLSAPAISLGVLVFVIGGGTGILWTGASLAGEASQVSAYRLDWRSPEPSDLPALEAALGEAVVPVIDEQAFATSCERLAAFLGITLPKCNPEFLVQRAEEAYGVEFVLQEPPVDETVSDVLISAMRVSRNDISAVVNAALPAANLRAAAGTESIRSPLLLGWVTGAMIIAATLLALAALQTFGDRLLALGPEDQRMLKLGIDAAQVSDVQRWTALAPLAPALGVGILGALLVSWSGVPHDLSEFPALVILVEGASVSVLALGVVSLVGRLQQRAHSA